MAPGPLNRRVVDYGLGEFRTSGLVTGTGGGLGQALAMAFEAAIGMWRLGTLRNRNAPEQRMLTLPLDVSRKASIESAVQRALQEWGRIDVLINNAGIARDGSTAQLDENSWDEVMAVNLKGAFLCAQAVLRAMVKQRSGHVISIASWSGRVGSRGQPNYSAAKAGLFGLTASLAREVGSRNIRVNAVLPGVLLTKMTENLSEEHMKAYAEANALGRINSFDEVVRFVVHLASMQNVSGQIFQLDSRIGAWS